MNSAVENIPVVIIVSIAPEAHGYLNRAQKHMDKAKELRLVKDKKKQRKEKLDKAEKLIRKAVKVIIKTGIFEIKENIHNNPPKFLGSSGIAEA